MVFLNLADEKLHQLYLNMKRIRVAFMMIAWVMCQMLCAEPVDYVSTLVGTLSKHSLSTGNTYPAIAMPWGMNF